jgi:hypothetical protein
MLASIIGGGPVEIKSDLNIKINTRFIYKL